MNIKIKKRNSSSVEIREVYFRALISVRGSVLQD